MERDIWDSWRFTIWLYLGIRSEFSRGDQNFPELKWNLNYKRKNLCKKIEDKKTELRKLQALYYNPKSIPNEIKAQVATQIEDKKNELKKLYNSPKDVVTLGKFGKWGAVQVVKAFLGMPIIPGR